PPHLGAGPGGRGQLRARRPDGGGQPHPGAGVRPGRPGRHVAQGQGVRRRPGRPLGGRAERAAQAARGGRLPVRGGRRVPGAAESRGLPPIREAPGWTQPYFRLEGYRVTTYHRNAMRGGAPIEDGDSIIDTEATVKVWAGDERLVAIG